MQDLDVDHLLGEIDPLISPWTSSSIHEKRVGQRRKRTGVLCGKR
jgi:hypothetical protein